MGEIQVELIVQHDSAASIYSEYLARHGEGLQHLGVMTASLDAISRGSKRSASSRYSGRDRERHAFAYVGTDRHAAA